VVLIIQSFVFGDGGITAIGANCFNMAIVMPFTAFLTFKLINGSAHGGTRFYAAAFCSGYLGLSTAALSTAFMFGIQPLIASAPDGSPLYAPYPLSIAIPVMAAEHMLVFGVVEGLLTALILKYFIKNEPELIYSIRKRTDEAI
jgi:cobalt/nickel transport system permease protein